MNSKNRLAVQSNPITSGGLIVSCQPVENGPMDQQSIIVAMAKAAVAGGCDGLRIQGAENVRAVKAQVTAPVIGIIKRDLDTSPVRITPYLEDVQALFDAGADVIAFDATDRPRPVSVEALVAEIHRFGLPAMADASTVSEGMAAHELGCEYIGSTLSGYTTDIAPIEPDLELVRQWHSLGLKVIAEGRFNSPELAADALASGAHAVTVGSAITRIELISQWFVKAMANAAQKSKSK